MSRYLKELKSGKLTVDTAKIKKAEKLDGKYLLSTSDKSLSAEDIALLPFNSVWMACSAIGCFSIAWNDFRD
jgi:hypothetical protein